MTKSTDPQTELDKLTQAITAQEALRGLLPDAQIEATLTALRQKKAELENQLAQTPPTQATLTGSGAIAQGTNSTALGAGAVQVTGTVGGPIITGSGNTLYTTPATPVVTLPPHLAPLRDQLTRVFNKGELQNLSFDLGIAHDDLPDQTRTELAQALVSYCYQQDRLPHLLARCRVLRPNATW